MCHTAWLGPQACRHDDVDGRNQVFVETKYFLGGQGQLSTPPDLFPHSLMGLSASS